MKYYHMTSLDRLSSIEDIGLVPRNEDNSKLVDDDKVKVFFSEGFEGCIALFVDFSIVYENIRNRKVKLDNKKLEEKILNSKDLAEYLKEGVYLEFEDTSIVNERNFENGCTSKIIDPKILNVCIIKDSIDNSIIYSRFEIIKYMMSRVLVNDIKYYGANYKDSPDTVIATKRIQEKVNKYYNNHKNEFEKYKDDRFVLEYMPLSRFIKKFM